MTLGQVLLELCCTQAEKVPISTKSRAITLSLLNESKRETPDAKLHIMTNIPIKFHDSRSSTFGAMLHTK